jgi:hypothetical protein
MSTEDLGKLQLLCSKFVEIPVRNVLHSAKLLQKHREPKPALIFFDEQTSVTIALQVGVVSVHLVHTPSGTPSSLVMFSHTSLEGVRQARSTCFSLGTADWLWSVVKAGASCSRLSHSRTQSRTVLCTPLNSPPTLTLSPSLGC